MTLFRIIQVLLILGGIGLLVFIHEFGHFFMSKLFKIKVLEFMIGLPGPKLFTFKKGETTFGLTAIPLGGYVKTVGADPYEKLTAAEKKRSLEHAPILKKSAVVLTGPLMNFALAIVLMVFVFSFIGIPQAVNSNQIGDLSKGYPAAQAGLKPGDRIVKVEGKPIANWNDLTREISKRPGEEISIDVKKQSGGERRYLLKTKTVSGKGKIGITPQVQNKPLPFIASVKHSFSMLWMVTSQTFIVIWNAFTGKPQPLLSSGRGIVGIVHETSALVTSIYNYIMIIAFLNLAVAVVNLLPIPPLDAGKIVIYVVELVKRKRLSKKTLTAVNAAGLALLLSVFVYFTIKDVGRILQAII